MTKEHFTCAECQTFDKITPEEEAIKEFEKHFPGLDIKDAAIVCDEFFEKNMALNDHPIGEAKYFN